MASDKISSIANLLEEIQNKLVSCLKYNEHIQASIYTVAQDLKENSNVDINCDPENCIKPNGKHLSSTAHEEFDYLEYILLAKIQEKAKLKMLNEGLQRRNQDKAHHINQLSQTVSLYKQRNSNLLEKISAYKDKVGKHNVEIQKLKAQLGIQTRKLNKTKTARLKLSNTSTRLSRGQQKSPEVDENSSSVMKVMIRRQAEKRSFEDLEEVFVERALAMITLNEEPNINDEIFDEPENLDSSEDEEMSDKILKESSYELFKASTDADSGISL